MKFHLSTTVVSLTTLVLSACGSSSESHGTQPGTGGAGVAPAGTGSTPGTPSGSGGGGGAPSTPSGTGGTTSVPAGTGGVVTGAGGAVVPPGGTGGVATGSGGAAPGAGGGGTGGACDDNELASKKVPCDPNADPCNLHSGYPGDAYCMLPPPAGQGIQIHFGPKNYTDMAEVTKYLTQPGEEFNAYGLATIPSDANSKYYNNIQIRMRPGSHHLINTLVTGTDSIPDGFVSSSAGCPGTPVASFPGTQNLIRNMPAGGKQAPENVGIGSQFPATSRLCVNHHAYNFDSDKPLLRELWINVWFVDAAMVTQKATGIFLTAGPFQGIAPHSQKVLKASTTVAGTGRIIDMFGHRHAATDRFAVWKNSELVYDSWHWDESVSYDYNSVDKNPAPNPDAKSDGATSGILAVKAGDKIDIECDVNNTTDNTLTFKNELYTGEMCILFGSSVGTTVGMSLP